MDIRQMEIAAEIVFRMCREHPEICPHLYEWSHSRTEIIDGKKIETSTYICQVCGNQVTKTEEKK